MFHVEQFEKIYTHLGFDGFKTKISSFNLYYDLLNKWNKVHNISSISTVDNFYFNHIVDSLVLAKVLSENSCNTIFDIGSGSGLPGIILAIMYPNKEFILLDSNKKKIGFLSSLSRKLNLKNIQLEHSRFENYIYPKNEFLVVNKALGFYDEQLKYFSKTSIKSFYFLCTNTTFLKGVFNNYKNYGFEKILIIKDIYDCLRDYNLNFSDRVIINVPRGTFCLRK